MSSAALVAAAQRLHKQGLMPAEIAERIGSTRGVVARMKARGFVAPRETVAPPIDLEPDVRPVVTVTPQLAPKPVQIVRKPPAVEPPPLPLVRRRIPAENPSNSIMARYSA